MTMTIPRNHPREETGLAVVQYANGKTLARAEANEGRFAPLVGFHVQVGRDADLDKAMRAANIARIEVRHQRPGGGEIVPHWFLGETIWVFPVTSGPVATSVAASLRVRNKLRTIEAGIGLRWGVGEPSRMAIRAYLDVLVGVGYVRPIQLSVRSRMTDVLLRALIDHERVCVIADSVINRERHPDPVAFHELALPLGPGEEEEWGDKNGTTTVVPFRSHHPATVDGAYLKTIWAPREVHEAAQQDWDEIQRWAREYATAPSADVDAAAHASVARGVVAA